jgi:hypothetical protein
MKRAGNENATRAQLMFDEEEDVLGIRLYDEYDVPEDGSAREASPEKSGVAVNLTPLLRYYGLPEPKTVGKQVFSVTFENNVIVIDLKEYRNAKERVRKNTPATATVEEFDDDIPF